MFPFKRLLAVLFYLSMPLVSNGQEFSMETNIPLEAVAGVQFRISFTVPEPAVSFKGPDMGGLDVVMGPAQSSNYSVTYNDGVRYEENRYSYDYIVKAPRAGDYEIGVATAVSKEGENVYRSVPVVVSVVATERQREEFTVEAIAGKDILLVAFTDKEQYVRGEPVRLYFRLLSRYKTGKVESVEAPSFEKCRVTELNTAHNLWSSIVYNSKPYMSYIVKEYLLYPEEAGEVEIGPLGITLQVAVPPVKERNTGSGPVMDIFRTEQTQLRYVDITVSSEPITFNVLEDLTVL